MYKKKAMKKKENIFQKKLFVMKEKKYVKNN